MIQHEDLYQFVATAWQKKALPSLMDYIQIPNKSPHFDKHWQEHGFMDKAVSHIMDWCQKNAPENMQLEKHTLPGRTPILLMDIPGTLEGSILFYGHLDKQPEMTGWREGLSAWEPVLEDRRLYGRGAADDGYAVFSALIALRALEAQKIAHPRCLILIEACEESGSYDLPYYLAEMKAKIGIPDLIIGLDSGAGNYEQFWMTTSLRGLITAELTVELIKEGVHSGNAGGIVADSFRVARALLSRLEDEETGVIKNAAFYIDIPKERVQQASLAATILGKAVYQELPFHKEVLPNHDNLQELILNRTWRPVLAVIGAEGLPSLDDAGNVLRPKTTLKLSLRLPPLVCPEKAAKALVQCLTENPPYQSKVTCTIIDKAAGWNAPSLKPWLEDAVDEASKLFYQNAPAYMGEGGSIPFMSMLGAQFPEAQFVITGVLGPHANAHGPNEFLDLDMVEKLTCCIAYIISRGVGR